MSEHEKPIVIRRWQVANQPFRHIDDGREEIDMMLSIPLTTTASEAESSIRELMDLGCELWVALYALPTAIDSRMDVSND